MKGIANKLLNSVMSSDDRSLWGPAMQAAQTINTMADRIVDLEGKNASLIQSGIKMLDQWRLSCEGAGILSGWLMLTEDPEHLEKLRSGTQDYLRRYDEEKDA